MNWCAAHCLRQLSASKRGVMSCGGGAACWDMTSSARARCEPSTSVRRPKGTSRPRCRNTTAHVQCAVSFLLHAHSLHGANVRALFAKRWKLTHLTPQLHQTSVGKSRVPHFLSMVNLVAHICSFTFSNSPFRTRGRVADRPARYCFLHFPPQPRNRWLSCVLQSWPANVRSL